MQISVFIATSLDGFIARLNGDIDWLDHPVVEKPEEPVTGDVCDDLANIYRDFKILG